MKQQIDLDDAIATVRDDEPSAVAAEAAAARVWARVEGEVGAAKGTVETIGGCADVQALLPAHRQRALQTARALLVEDHLRDCAACRAAFREPGGRRLATLPWRAAPNAPKPAPMSLRRGAFATAALLAVGLAGLAAHRAFFGVPPRSPASVQSVSGVLQRVAEGRAPALQPGDEIGEAESVRTARGSRAHLRLRDGSIVEMGERAELSLSARGDDATIRLERGSIIVQAAKRRSGRLLVASKDCTVYVKGTVFSVSGGLKGSRVSVLEGLVRVVRGGDEKLLQPGEQWATSESMGTVSVRDEIAWSRDLDQHLNVLGELQALGEKWNAIPRPGLRHESRLLSALPEQTVVFASLPNYGQALADAHRLFQEQLEQSPVLRDWWQKADPARHGGPSLAHLIDRVRDFADYLGDEVAFAAVEGRAPRGPQPFLLAEVRRPGLREFIESEIAEAAREREGRGPVVNILDEASLGSAAPGPGLFVLLRPDLMAIAVDTTALRGLASDIQARGGLTATAFGQRIANAYREGVGLLFAADFERIVDNSGIAPREASMLHDAGIDGLRHLIVERKELLGQAQTEAALAFTGERRGIPSWLAAPGPMGSLEFVSPHAQAAAVFLSKSPALVLADLLGILDKGDVRAAQKLAELEAKLGLRLGEDVAATLGAEWALALDGPLLPTPAWRLVVEVYDPVRLQASLQVLVGKANDEAVAAGRPGFRLEAEQAGDQIYHSLKLPGGDLPFDLHYTFADGYLVAGPTRALVMHALRTRETGDTLARSAAFRTLFPPGRHDHTSGLVYQNLGGFVGRLVDLGRSTQLTPGQQRLVESLGRNSKPTLFCAYGEPEAIQLAGIGGSLDLSPATLMLPLLLEHGVPGTLRRETP